MKHVPFTTEIGEGLVKVMQAHFETNCTLCSSWAYPITGGKKPKYEAKGTYCYRYCADTLQQASYDHFGIVYQGWSGAICKQKLGPEAELWLEYLLDTEGPFRGLLPFLWHTKPSEIMADKGFVFKDLVKPKGANMGLLWTFAQATRYFFENPTRMARFLYAVKELPKDKTMALFATLTLQPMPDKITDKSPWTYTMVAHGEPLGNGGDKRAAAFLGGVLTPTKETQGTGGSAACFGGSLSSDYRSAKQMLFHEWIAMYEKERKSNAKAA